MNDGRSSRQSPGQVSRDFRARWPAEVQSDFQVEQPVCPIGFWPSVTKRGLTSEVFMYYWAVRFACFSLRCGSVLPNSKIEANARRSAPDFGVGYRPGPCIGLHGNTWPKVLGSSLKAGYKVGLCKYTKISPRSHMHIRYTYLCRVTGKLVPL